MPEPVEFVATVQSLPPAHLPGAVLLDSPPATDFDIGLAGDMGSVAAQPTLSHIGRYALKNVLGEGGLGRVYEAWDPLLSRTVAVKTLQFDLDMPSRIALDRLLLNEARAAASLSHAHIVTVHDAGLSAHGVYIAMERLRGRDLRQALAEGWRPTPAQAAQIVRRVADALAYAHARGIVHCDIKPGNIFLTRKDKPKVLDFGIARAAHASALPASDGMIAGSPHYLAPEQVQGGAVDGRTDIYALGVVLYELLTGRKAFAGESLAQIHAAVLNDTPSPVHGLRPEVPGALSDIVARMMSRDPAQRPASGAELSQALRHWAQAPPDGEPAPASAPSATPSKRWLALALLGCAGAAAMAWGLGPSPGAIERRAPDAPTVASAAPPARVESATAPAAEAAIKAPVKTPAAQRPGTGPARGKAAAPAPTIAVGSAAVAPKAHAGEAVTGNVQIAVSPWGQVDVNGTPAGTTPPLTRLTLPEGAHTITVRNADFTPFTTTVQVHGDRTAVVRHRFGS